MRAHRILASALLMAACSPAFAADFKHFPRDMRICTENDVNGLFKLHEVLEKPGSGPVTNEFHRIPHQYIFFRKTQSYLEVDGSRAFADAKSMNAELAKHEKTDSRQYVLAESGALYFYKNSRPIAAYTCEMVNKLDPPYYAPGDMLLIAYGPNGTLSVRVFRPLNFAKPTPPPPPPRRRGRFAR